MSLSEQEQKALREIEQSLLADDPKFGASVAGDGGSGVPGAALTLRAVALGVLGLVLLIGGVALSQQSLWFIILSVVGFVVMFGAGVWALRGGGAAGSESRRSVKPKNSGKPSGSSRMEENFRRRFEGQ